MNIRHKHTTKRKVIITVLTVVILIILYLILARIRQLPPFNSAQENNNPGGSQFINMDRTQTEKDASNALKDDPTQKTQNNQTDTPQAPSKSLPSGKRSVDVMITNRGVYNGTVSASGMVMNVVDSGGQCTYTFVNGNESINKVSSTLENPTSTTCQTVSFPASELPNGGAWTVQLQYDSAIYHGTSTAEGFKYDP